MRRGAVASWWPSPDTDSVVLRVFTKQKGTVDHRQAVQAGYDGFASGDPGPLFSLMDPNIDWHLAEGYPYGGTYVGLDTIANGVFAKLGSEWDGYIMTPDFIVVDGDRAISIACCRNTRSRR